MKTGPSRTLDRIAWALATGLGSGWMRPGPGTWGSLAALVAGLAFRNALAPHLEPGRSAWILGGLLPACGLGLLGVWASGRVARITGIKDPGFIVIDEWAGQWMALLGLPFTAMGWLNPWPLVAFGFFRLLDIWKPGPIHTLQRLPGGWGIVADDLLAGLLAALLTAALRLGCS